MYLTHMRVASISSPLSVLVYCPFKTCISSCFRPHRAVTKSRRSDRDAGPEAPEAPVCCSDHVGEELLSAFIGGHLYLAAHDVLLSDWLGIHGWPRHCSPGLCCRATAWITKLLLPPLSSGNAPPRRGRLSLLTRTTAQRGGVSSARVMTTWRRRRTTKRQRPLGTATRSWHSESDLFLQGPKGEAVGSITQPLPSSHLIFRATSESDGKRRAAVTWQLFVSADTQTSKDKQESVYSVSASE